MDADFLARAETRFLDAATDPDLWRSAMDDVVQATGSLGASLLTVDGRGPFILATDGVAELADQYVRDGWYQRDYRYAAVPRLRKHGFFVDQQITTTHDMARNPYYADYLVKKGAGWGIGLRIDTGDDMWCLMIQRGMGTGAYQEDEQERLKPLVGIINRAASLSRRLEFARLDGAAEASEMIGGACLFIDRFGRVARMNAAAEAMVGRKFLIRHGRVAFAHCASEPLQRHIDAAIWPDLAAADKALRPVVVPQLSGRPLIFQAIRMRGNTRILFAPAYAMLLVTDLNEKAGPPPEHLQAVFQLTTAEARLADALLQQFSLVEAADHLNLKHETARTHLKSIFAKTETRTQAQLIHVLESIRRR